MSCGLYRTAQGAAIVITLVHILCLTYVASYDGMEYVHLANLLGTHDFATGWNYLRTPLFPAALRAAFALGGQQPQAAMLVTSLLGCAGVLAMGSVVRFVAGSIAGAVSLLLLSFYPVLIVYEHMLLTESGIFFFLSLLIWLLVRGGPAFSVRSLAVAIALAVANALGFYWRPTILYLSPVVALAFVLTRYVSPESLRPYRDLRRSVMTSGAQLIRDVVIVSLGPWLLAWPWMHLSQKHPSTDMLETITTGMYKQVLVPPEDPLFGELGEEYRTIIKAEEKNGRIPLDGLSIVGEGRHTYLKALSRVYMKAGLIKLIAGHPLRYALAVSRSFVYFLGVPHHRVDDENWSFAHFVFGAWPTGQDFEHLPGWIPEYAKQFEPQRYAGNAGFSKLLRGLFNPYAALVLMGSLVSLWWMVVSLRLGSGIPFALTGVPMAFLLLHSLTMMSAVRYAFPVYPIVLANFCAFSVLCWKGRAHKRVLDSTRR